jgi:hypothetical protein
MERVSTGERRSGPRNAHENRATTLIQSILKDPMRAAAELEIDLNSGGDIDVIMALLSAAESLASLRGIDLGSQVAAVRRRLKKGWGTSSDRN